MWEPIRGLTPKANSLFGESAAMVEFLASYDGGDWSVVEDVLKELWKIECSIMDLREVGELYE